MAVAIVVGMVGWGVPLMARLAGMLITQDSGVGGVEELAPAAPVFSDVPEATNSGRVSIGGFAQPGVEVTLLIDGLEKGLVLTDEAGVFEFEQIEIGEGESKVEAYSVSSRGSKSELSRGYLIRVDRTPPELVLSAPENGQVYRGQGERIAVFQGMVDEEGVKVYVGERMAIVSTDDTFQLSYQLIEGEQEVEVRAVDKAGNETKKTISLTWEQ